MSLRASEIRTCFLSTISSCLPFYFYSMQSSSKNSPKILQSSYIFVYHILSLLMFFIYRHYFRFVCVNFHFYFVYFFISYINFCILEYLSTINISSAYLLLYCKFQYPTKDLYFSNFQEQLQTLFCVI